MAQITTTMLRGRWQGSDRWLSDGGARGAGRLTARLTRDGVLLYFQYFLPGTGKVQRVPLGPYDEAGTRGLSLVQARDKAAELAALYRGAPMISTPTSSANEKPQSGRARLKRRPLAGHRKMLSARRLSNSSTPTSRTLIVAASSLHATRRASSGGMCSRLRQTLRFERRRTYRSMSSWGSLPS